MTPPAETPTRARLRRSARDPVALASLVVVILVVLAALGAPYLAPRDPYTQSLRDRRAAPSARFLLGADEFGRDELSRAMYGARLALRTALVATAIGLVSGAFLGLCAGFFGGLYDDVIMRAMDVLLAFPYLLLAIAIASALGPGEVTTQIAIGCWALPSFARLVRGAALSLREREFVEAARALGAGALRIMTRHVLPHTTWPLLAFATLFVARAILIEAALSFLGLGAQPPAASWGSMVASGRDYLRIAPHIALVPGAAIALTVLAFNLLGDGLRVVFDPQRSGV
jgi:ABC-type dipeptide/oligopeptide/nickel transport system permease subunit